ncbi:MAG: hypothetical protein J5I98_15455 [Phaeodactylibacter sp.]|nr:hypothetical protein [Phaeodactylibacter sp.]
MKHNIILSLFWILTLASCSKDDGAIPMPPVKQCNSTLYASLLPADTCLDFPDLWGPTYIYHRVGPGYALIGKNPDNPDEWLYLIHPEGAGINDGSEIWKIDTCSGRKQFLLDEIKSQPKVNKQGWMIFRRTFDGLMYRISLQGGGLLPISNVVAHDLFDWCLDGEAFFYRARFKDVSYLSTIDGTVFDSFNLDYHAIAGRKNQIAFSMRSENSGFNTRIAILNLDNGGLTDLVNLDGIGIGSPDALSWENDNALIGLFVHYGLYRIHIPSGVVELVKEEVCDNTLYYFPSIDQQNPSWFFLSKQNHSYPDTGQVYFTTDMVVYNTETGEEWKLDLDQ